MGDKKEKFYSRVKDLRKAHGKQGEWKRRYNGHRVKLFSWISTFVYTVEDPGDPEGCGGPFDAYFVIEEITGCSFGRGLSEEEAVKFTQEALGNMGKKEAWRKVVKQAMPSNISPKFRPKMRKAIAGWLKEIEEANS